MDIFWQQLLGTLAGNTLLIGLAGFLGKIYIERIARNEQASIDTVARHDTAELQKQMDKLKQEHEKILVKDEHFHQISQETYQRLFEFKIEVYKELNKLKLEYEVPIPYDTNQIDFKNIDNRDLLTFRKFQKIIAYIGNKAVYITPNLHEKVDNFKTKTAKKIHDIEDYIYFHSDLVSDPEDADNLSKYEAVEYSKLFEETTIERLEVIKQINYDILKISRYIHGDTL